jgi:AGZA family xanthine/uracil permease-like MFS transporter
MRNQGVWYRGLQVLGGGSILGGLMLAAIAAFIIDRKFLQAAGFALGAAALTFFGLMHGEKIGFGQTLPVAGGYLGVAVILAACAKFAVVSPKPAEHPEPTSDGTLHSATA